MGGQKKLGTVRGMGRDVIGQGTGRKGQERKGGRGGEGSQKIRGVGDTEKRLCSETRHTDHVVDISKLKGKGK